MLIPFYFVEMIFLLRSFHPNVRCTLFTRRVMDGVTFDWFSIVICDTSVTCQKKSYSCLVWHFYGYFQDSMSVIGRTVLLRHIKGARKSVEKVGQFRNSASREFYKLIEVVRRQDLQEISVLQKGTTISFWCLRGYEVIWLIKGGIRSNKCVRLGLLVFVPNVSLVKPLWEADRFV